MSKYFTVFVRAFKPSAAGTNFMAEVVEEFKSLELNAPGVVTGTGYAQGFPGPVAVLSRLHEDASGIDSYHSAVMNSSDERNALVQRLSEKCISTTFRISRLIKEGNYVGSNPPSCLVRNYIKVKRGYIDEAIEIMSSFIDNIPDDRTKPVLSESTTGRAGLLTLSIPYETFAAAEEGYARVRENSGTPMSKRLAEITEENMRVPTFILHSTIQPN
ncbi:MAG: hypothetical protein ACJ0BL_04635 [Dehalococcoidia bacterium]